MTTTAPRCCATCAFFMPREHLTYRADIDADGECHVRAPHATHGWAAVSGLDWCGQWKRPWTDQPPEAHDTRSRPRPPRPS